MGYFGDMARVTSRAAISSVLKQEILLRPEFGIVFNVSAVKDSSGTDMAIMFKARGTIVDPATTTPFT